ncbi:HNH endonuclease family protein [Amycolatopsis sp. NPDC059021]|uniref:HNH endonuclease family protein n=1 Tax=Amycolatopsis sp. NPDC059021 TaxID=3346704 RepID=UPI00366BFB36
MLRLFILALLSALVGVIGLTGYASATPPNIPDAPTAKAELTALRVAEDGSMDGYSRTKFPHWIDQGDGCNTREVVLKRDGTDVTVDEDCRPISGNWRSPYDGETWDSPSDIDIDHLVPLADAWRTGAASWTTAKRRAFANDLASPQLIAVTNYVNREKGDKTPDEWKPPLVSYWCTYAKMWTHVKHRWQLSITSAEKSALTGMLARC